MKKMIIPMMFAVLASMNATGLYAQDDIYYTKKNAQKAIYAATASDEWHTNANDDWDLDDYNRRGNTSAAPDEVSYTGNAGGTVQYAAAPTQVVHDTVVHIIQVDPYAYTDRIHRFHNPLFGYYAYSPWYDVAYYDPFYWDFCYWDPWWWRTPSFGYHWGSWYVGWNPGYYGGWYGGWYSPYYPLHPHHYGPVWGGGGYTSHRHTNRGARNNMGGNFRSQPGIATGTRGGSRGTSTATAGGSRRNQSGTIASSTRAKSNMGTRTQSSAPATSGNRTTTATQSTSGSTRRQTSAAASSANRTSAANTTRQQAASHRSSSASRTTESSTAVRSSSASRTSSTPSYNNSSSRSSSSSSYSSGSSTRSSSSGSYSGGGSSRGGGSSSGGGSRGGRR